MALVVLTWIKVPNVIPVFKLSYDVGCIYDDLDN